MHFRTIATEFALGATLLGAHAFAQTGPTDPYGEIVSMPTRESLGTVSYDFTSGGCTTNNKFLKNAVGLEVSRFDLGQRFGFSYSDDMEGLMATFAAPVVQKIINDVWQRALKSPDAAIVADPETSPADLFAANKRLYDQLWDGMEQAAMQISNEKALETHLSFDAVVLAPIAVFVPSSLAAPFLIRRPLNPAPQITSRSADLLTLKSAQMMLSQNGPACRRTQCAIK